MKINIAKLRLTGIISFALFLVIAFIKLIQDNGPNAEAAHSQYKSIQSVLIFIAVCCFFVIFCLQAWKLITTYYVKKEDIESQD